MDNGQGIGERQSEPGRASSGHGMKSLAKRMNEIGGRCDIASVPGEGTEIRFRVPFPNGGHHRN
jgi:signal transduction histidine kinase